MITLTWSHWHDHIDMITSHLYQLSSFSSVIFSWKLIPKESTWRNYWYDNLIDMITLMVFSLRRSNDKWHKLPLVHSYIPLWYEWLGQIDVIIFTWWLCPLPQGPIISIADISPNLTLSHHLYMAAIDIVAKFNFVRTTRFVISFKHGCNWYYSKI